MPQMSHAELEKHARRLGDLVEKGHATPGTNAPHGEINATTALAKELGAKTRTVRRWVKQMRERGLSVHWGEKPLRKPLKAAPTIKSGSQVFLLTAAQDDTDVHEGFLKNLEAYARHRNAEILIGGFTYQKGLFEDHMVESGIFDHRVDPYLQPQVIDLAPGLTWFGKANILPTAVNPLSGWDTQTRENWTIFPHAKIALKSVPVMPGRRPKQIMSTGVVTKENYVQRNAGQKAEFHHTVGATVVEIASDGAFWCRQISAEHDGAFQDLEIKVRDGQVTNGHRVEAINFGDIHTEVIDVIMARAGWGYAPGDRDWSEGNMLDTLKPRFWFADDSFDFTPRSHHTRNDPHERARRIAEGMDNVEDAISLTAELLGRMRRDFGELIHKAANHNMHLDNWLKDHKAAADPVNACYWHELNAAWHRAIKDGADSRWLIHEEALRRAHPDRLEGIRFLSEGESFTICQGVAPIECGLHGHVGPRGSRGSVTNLAKIVERVNDGHGHGPAIMDGHYRAGTFSRRDMAWSNKGPGDWQPASIITTPNGKRTIVTHWEDGRWRL